MPDFKNILLSFIPAFSLVLSCLAEDASVTREIPDIRFPSFDMSYGFEINAHSFEPDWDSRWKANDDSLHQEVSAEIKEDLLWERYKLMEEANRPYSELSRFGQEALDALSRLARKSAQQHLREAYLQAKAGHAGLCTKSICDAWITDASYPFLYPEAVQALAALPDNQGIHPGCAFLLRSWICHGRNTLDRRIETNRDHPDPDVLLARTELEAQARAAESMLRRSILKNRWSVNSSLWAQFERALNVAAIPDTAQVAWLDQALAAAPDRIDIHRERMRLDVTLRLANYLSGRKPIDVSKALQRKDQGAVAGLLQSMLGFESPKEGAAWVDEAMETCFMEADSNLPFHREISFLRLLFSEQDAIPWTLEQMLEHTDDLRWVDRYMILKIANSVGLSRAQEWAEQAPESDMEPLRKAFHDKHSVRAGMILVRCMLSSRDYQAATGVVRKLIDIDPSNAWHPTALACLQLLQDRPDEAITAIDLAFDRLKGHESDLRSTLWLYLANARSKKSDTIGTIDAMIIAAWLGDPDTLKGWQDLSFLPDPEPFPWTSLAEFVTGDHPDSQYNPSVFFANATINQLMGQTDASLDKARRLLDVLTREVNRQWERGPDFNDPSKISILNRFLGNRIHFDYSSNGVEASLFADTLLNRAGNCVGQSLVYTLLARNLGLDCTARLLPGHMIAQYIAPTGALAIECTDGFRENTDLTFFRVHFPDENSFQAWANAELKLNTDAHLGLTRNTLNRIVESNQRGLSEAIFNQFKDTWYIQNLLPSIAESHLLVRTIKEAPPQNGPWTPRGMDVTRLTGNQIFEAHYEPTPLGLDAIQKIGELEPLTHAIHLWHTNNREKALSIVTRMSNTYQARDLALEWSLQLAEAGSSGLALDTLNAVLQRSPQDIEVQVRIAEILDETGNTEEARQVAEEILKVIPFQPQALSIASGQHTGQP
ncbi:MAG: tetratricopeptide repeat protein [Opitutales bacterium]|nr:tetratricopeptide repeat protein [Opitutales bacterium]